MKLINIILGVGFLLIAIALFMLANRAEAPAPEPDTTLPETSTTTEEIEGEDSPDLAAWPFEAKPDLIVVDTVAPGDYLSSPLTVAGEARGYWFFEASFSVMLTNWDGLIIAEGIATAETDWMTEDFVPFTTELEFTSPYRAGDPDFMRRGSLILQKSNPSGLPENDNALEIPILFNPAP